MKIGYFQQKNVAKSSGKANQERGQLSVFPQIQDRARDRRGKENNRNRHVGREEIER